MDTPQEKRVVETYTKDGVTASVCTYRWTDPSDNSIDTCRHAIVCPICQQCSRLEGDKENGHCPGHYGLMPHIWVPGRDQALLRRQQDRIREEVRERRKQGRGRKDRKP